MNTKPDDDIPVPAHLKHFDLHGRFQIYEVPKRDRVYYYFKTETTDEREISRSEYQELLQIKNNRLKHWQ